MGVHRDFLSTMNEENILNLDRVVLGALELFAESDSFTIPDFPFKKPVIIGSGNAKNTIQIIYALQDVIFADENNYMLALTREGVDGVVIYSASGGKHAPIIAKYALDLGLQVRLVSCNENSETTKIIGRENTVVTPKNKEPYTYNTSTYMGWILANTRENPREILEFLEKTLPRYIPDNFSYYTGFLLAIPNKFASIAPLIDIKFIELFGRNIARDIKTFEELRHAVTVVPSSKELAISFGEGEFYFHGNILHIPVPATFGPAAFMALGYYLVGKIQEQQHPYFREHIGEYIENLKKSDFGNGMGVIV